ncbi:glycosyltransferase, partial [Listeria monocytogenes]
MLLSIVVPCYNEEEVIDFTKLELFKLMDELDGLDAELIFVNDGSRDCT